MVKNYAEVMFTKSVQAAQDHYGTRAAADRMAESDDRRGILTDREVEFIAQRDGFYMASVNEDGWPYVQFRGGPAGFLKALDEKTLGYADFRGNQQYISVGNLAQEDRVSLFFMDYANRKRLKMVARARVVDADDDPELVARVEDPDYRARIERAIVFDVVAFDWNCPQHIAQRYTEAEWNSRSE